MSMTAFIKIIILMTEISLLAEVSICAGKRRIETFASRED
jgi:hypothetical protein